MTNYGIKLPLSAEKDAFDEHTNITDSLKQDMLVLLNANWGDYIGDYYRGCNLIDFIFEKSSKIDKAIASRIIQTFNKYLPLVSVNEIQIINFENNSRKYDIIINFSIEDREKIVDEILKTSVNL